jgi:hypothetical protein
MLVVSPAVWTQTTTTHNVPSGRFHLAAELTTPAGGEHRKAAVVFTPGAGDQAVSQYMPGFVQHLLWDVFLPRDIAVLTVNKRGLGGSTGNWKRDSMESRAADVLAAVEYLRVLPGIDPERIGIVGHSQGGWVVQLAASRDERLAFAISYAGPVVTVEEQDLRRTRIELECSAAGPDDVKRRVARRRRFLSFMGSVGRWLPISELPLMSHLLAYDPEPALRAIRIPILLAYGERDSQAPPDDSLSRLDRILPHGVPSAITVHVEPRADHFFRDAPSVCVDYGTQRDLVYIESFRAYVGAWVDARLAERVR